jgi:hypothetical protein
MRAFNIVLVDWCQCSIIEPASVACKGGHGSGMRGSVERTVRAAAPLLPS